MAASSSSSAGNYPVEGHGDYTLKNPPVPEWVAHHQLSESKFSDVSFSFEGKQVYAHSMILCVRCQVLYELFDKQAHGKKKKKTKALIHLSIPQPYENYPITPESFELVLQFLYADNIQFETIDARSALDLCNAARVFELPRLVRLCRDRVHETISLDNVHALLKVAHDTKEEKVRAYCVRFASGNRKEFIGNKPEIANIGVDLFQDVMAALMMDDEEDLAEKNPPPNSTLLNDFKKLHTDIDVGAIQGDSVVSFKGSEIQFHKSFFAAHSKSLSASFQPAVGGDENTTEILKVKTILTTNDAFRAILRYLYYGDLSGLNVLVACEVQEFAKTHGMIELQHICEFVMAVNINVESVMSIMKVVFNPGNIKRPDLAEVRKNTLTFFRQNIVKLDLDMMALLQNGPLVMAEIIMAWQVAKQAQAQGVSEEDVRSKRGADMQIPAGTEALEDPASISPSESQTSLGADEEKVSRDSGSRPMKPNKQNSAMLTEEERKGKKTVGKKGKKGKEAKSKK